MYGKGLFRSEIRKNRILRNYYLNQETFFVIFSFLSMHVAPVFIHMSLKPVLQLCVVKWEEVQMRRIIFIFILHSFVFYSTYISFHMLILSISSSSHAIHLIILMPISESHANAFYLLWNHFKSFQNVYKNEIRMSWKIFEIFRKTFEIFRKTFKIYLSKAGYWCFNLRN